MTGDLLEVEASRRAAARPARRAARGRGERDRVTIRAPLWPAATAEVPMPLLSVRDVRLEFDTPDVALVTTLHHEERNPCTRSLASMKS
jgi:hypothetical protein